MIIKNFLGTFSKFIQASKREILTKIITFVRIDNSFELLNLLPKVTKIFF